MKRTVNRFALILCLLAAGALVSASARAQLILNNQPQIQWGQPQIQWGLTSVAGRTFDFYTNQFDAMGRDLTLTDDQRTELKSDIDAMNKALNAAEEEVFGPPSPSPRFPGEDAMQALQAKLDDIVGQNEAKIIAALPEDQRTRWATTFLESLVTSTYRNLGMTDEQMKKTTDLIAASAKSLAAETDPQKFAAIQDAMVHHWIADVLTDHQAIAVLNPNAGPSITGRQVKAAPAPAVHNGDADLP